MILAPDEIVNDRLCMCFESYKLSTIHHYPDYRGLSQIFRKLMGSLGSP